MKSLVATFTEKRRVIIFWGMLGAALGSLFWLHASGPRLVDEMVHIPQIQSFASGDFQWRPDLAMLPGYHAIMALLLQGVGSYSLEKIRLLSFLGGASRLIFFYLLAARFWPEQKYLRTIQCAFFPVLFPYCFLVYNDVWTVTFTLLSLYLVLQKRLVWSAVAIAVAVLIRQSVIFWAGLMWILATGETLPSMRRPAVWPEIVRKTWPFLVVLVLFCGFVWWNGGVAIGDRHIQQVTFNLTNAWFYLFTFVLLFLPDCIRGIRYGVRAKSTGEIQPAAACPSVRLDWRAAGVVAVLALLLGLTYDFPHLFNRINIHYILHNIVLRTVTDSSLASLLALAVIPLGLAGMLLTPLAEERFRWLLPLTIFSLLGMPYIDPRYFAVPLTLFLLWRRPLSRPVEIGLTLYYVAFSFWLNEVSFRQIYFP